MIGPESVLISQEEHHDLITQVARALKDQWQAQNGMLDNEEIVFDFTELAFDIN